MKPLLAVVCLFAAVLCGWLARGFWQIDQTLFSFAYAILAVPWCYSCATVVERIGEE